MPARFIRRTAIVITVLLVSAVVIPFSAAAETATSGVDWYQYLGPTRNNLSPETGWNAQFSDTGPERLWETNVHTGFATTSVSRGRAYTMGNDGKQDIVYCFDAETGETLWIFAYPCKLHSIQHEGGPCATPAIDGTRVYTFSKQGHLHCLDTDRKGKVIWSLNVKEKLGAKVPRWGFSGSPLVEKNLLIVEAGKTYALDKMTGETIWESYKDMGAGYASPVAFDHEGKRFVAVFNGYGLAVMDVTDGRQITRLEWDTKYKVNAATPVIADNGHELFISSSYNKGCAVVTLNDGQVNARWQNKEMRNHFNTSVLWEGYLYGFDDNTLKCVDYKTGKATWSKDRLGKGSLILADNKLIILSERGELVIAEANPSAFKEISRAKVLDGKCWTAPVLSHGRIYCRNAKGRLVCLDVKGKKSN